MTTAREMALYPITNVLKQGETLSLTSGRIRLWIDMTYYYIISNIYYYLMFEKTNA